MDAGLELLRNAPAHPDRPPEQDCQAVLDALLPDRPRDDIALLVARSKRLDPGRGADWDVPSATPIAERPSGANSPRRPPRPGSEPWATCSWSSGTSRRRNVTARAPHPAPVAKNATWIIIRN
ncbi:hypothetical protein [Streptomyces sp. enrichment culture]|uniref:hypothetical protein n=1 Tax=Streptomyces sp. enrichment culture TaxID=1795815 RepID=UPI003F57875C